MGDGQPVADHSAQSAHHLVTAVVEVTGADGGGQDVLVRIAEPFEGGPRFGCGLIEQFTLYGAQDVGGDEGVEVDRPGGVGPDVALEEFGDGGDEFGGGGPPVE